MSLDGEHGIWFTGSYWVVGNINELNAGKLTYRYLELYDSSVIDCPTKNVGVWREFNYSWGHNTNIGVKCDGKLLTP